MNYQDGIPSFGHWLKQQRKRLGLTQEVLAQRIGCASITIKRIEAGTIRPSQHLAERILKHLDIPRTDWEQLIQAARNRNSTEERCESPEATALPRPLTSFVGRDQELHQLRSWLLSPDIQFVTLTGVGGVGKTRLALQVAAELHKAFADGVRFVSLDALTHPTQVLPTVACSLGIEDTPDEQLDTRLANVLRTKHLLLVLDTMEHVAEAAPALLALLSNSPSLTMLVTSRMVLRVSCEHVFTIAPLPLAEQPHTLPLETLADNPAIALFTARAQTATADFALTASNALVVAAICDRLEGLPLAIELAAARLRLFTLPTLLARLDQRLHVLAGGGRDLPARQQTIRDLIAWSYNLLDDKVHAVLMQLSVFVGSFTLEAAEAVCTENAGMPVVEAIEILLMQNLLQRVDRDEHEPRFSMPALIQEYAHERLVSKCAVALARERHALYYLEVIDQAEQELDGPHHFIWIHWIEQEYGNILAVLNWMSEQSVDPTLFPVRRSMTPSIAHKI